MACAQEVPDDGQAIQLSLGNVCARGRPKPQSPLVLGGERWDQNRRRQSKVKSLLDLGERFPSAFNVLNPGPVEISEELGLIRPHLFLQSAQDFLELIDDADGNANRLFHTLTIACLSWKRKGRTLKDGIKTAVSEKTNQVHPEKIVTRRKQ